jgi:hypothetical protein
MRAVAATDFDLRRFVILFWVDFYIVEPVFLPVGKCKDRSIWMHENS